MPGAVNLNPWVLDIKLDLSTVRGIHLVGGEN